MKELFLPQVSSSAAFFVVGEVWPLLALWLAVTNAAAFAMMGSDKKRACTRGARRIPERRLFLSALLGGSIGAMLGMLVFHHKTEKWYFALGMPLILLAQAALLFLIL